MARRPIRTAVHPHGKGRHLLHHGALHPGGPASTVAVGSPLGLDGYWSTRRGGRVHVDLREGRAPDRSISAEAQGRRARPLRRGINRSEAGDRSTDIKRPVIPRTPAADRAGGLSKEYIHGPD
ncbi:MAG: hypothetical protein MZV70_69595 [Desulfobacterales bacterium]|nr:hypothetical protein [Desulfobacterales bacterium]